MSSYDYNLRLRALRQKTILIGVVGMAACGKKEFNNVLVEKGYPIFEYDYEGIMDNTILPVTELGVFSQARREEIIQMDSAELITAMSEDYKLYALAKNAMFDIHMNIISDKIRDVLMGAPDIINSGVAFIQCPLSTKFKYNDVFDAVITINRPQTYDESSWWVQYYTDGMSPQFPSNVAINSLKNSDSMYNEIRFTESTTINNNGSLDAFIASCDNVIDDVVEVLQSR